MILVLRDLEFILVCVMLWADTFFDKLSHGLIKTF